MDKAKECDVPEHVFTGDVSMESGEKLSNFFKEPAGMTTICLSDAPIPDERKFGEKFTIVNGVKKHTRLLWILMSIILILLLLTLYENEGYNVFQNTQPDILIYQDSQDNTSLPSNSVNDIKFYEYTTPSTEPENTTFNREITSDIVHTESKEGYTKSENSISGSLVINSHFIGVAAANSKSGDEDPNDILDVLDMLGYMLKTKKPNRKKRSQQGDTVDVIVAAPRKLGEHCGVQADKNTSSSASNIDSEKEKVSEIREGENDVEKNPKRLQPHKSETESEINSWKKQKKQATGTVNPPQSKSGANRENNDSTIPKHTSLLLNLSNEAMDHGRIDKSKSIPIPAESLTRESTNHDKDEQITKQIGNDLNLNRKKEPVRAKVLSDSENIPYNTKEKDIPSIKPEHISTLATKPNHMEKTQSSNLLDEHIRIKELENVSVPVAALIENNSSYAEDGRKANSKSITGVLDVKKDYVQSKAFSFTENLDTKTEEEIFHSTQPEYIATPITEPSQVKESQSTLNEQGRVNKTAHIHLLVGTKQITNSTYISKKPVNYEYVEYEKLDNGNIDVIDDPYMPVTAKKFISSHATTLQPHIEVDYTADPHYEQERSSAHHSSSPLVINIPTESDSENFTKYTSSNPSFIIPNKAKDEIKLQAEIHTSTQNNSNGVTATTKTTHSPVILDSSTENGRQISINEHFTTEPTAALSTVTDDVISPRKHPIYFSLKSKTEDKSKENTVLSEASAANFSQFQASSSVGTTPGYVEATDSAKNNRQNSKAEQPPEDTVGMTKGTHFEYEPKKSVEASLTEQIQSSQMQPGQMQSSQLQGHPYSCAFPPMGYPMPLPQYFPPPLQPYPYSSSQNDQLKIINAPFPNRKSQILILNPPVINYGSPYLMAPENFRQVGSSYGGFPPASPVQTSDHNGQFYMCNAIPAPYPDLINVPDVEVRKGLIGQGLYNRERTFSHTTPLVCPIDHVSCSDNSRCIKQNHICDGEADCKDGSDESNCTCKDRIEAFRHCDGYIDCPEGEDEIGCFGCTKDEFSCNDWNPRYRKSTCIPLEQRCDGIEQCPVGFDEIDCSVLTDTLEEHKLIKVSNAVGYLNRNYKGKWYPTCFGTEVWAAEVCKTESGPNPHHLIHESRLIKVKSDYKGPYIEETQNEGLHLKHKCAMEGTATFVLCPPLICGMRLKIYNPYRMQEIETSHEILEEMSPDQQLSDNILGDSRIVGGVGSQPASWPWVVAMYKNGIFHCSGVIISEMWIVSAAHCVDKYWLYYYEIQAGVLRRFSYAPQTQIRRITHAIPYPSYNKSTLQHDIALLKLSDPLRYNRYVRPICLPSESTAGTDYFNAPYPGTECTVVGWGATSEHSADPDHLREVRVPVLPVCKYEDDRESNAICAGFTDGGKDACQGDSGGPFMCLNPNQPHQWYLAGVVSHGEGCARPDEPGIYTRVSLYVEWIMEHVNSQHLPPQMPLEQCPGYVCRGTNRCISKKRHCDKIVDCLHGDDELSCYGWKLDEYLRHMEYMVGRNAHSLLEDSEEENNTRDLIVGEPLNTTFQLLSNENDKFTCKKLLQRIPQSKRCNRVADCEDGTDEIGCTCRDYLRTTSFSAICDGITDCADLSDETDCSTCKSSEFQCRLSNRCISLKKRCDGIADCPYQEDEWDCLALTNGTTVSLDADGHPELRNSGIIAANYGGTWRVTCISQQEIEKQAPIAAFICSYFGFNDYYKFKVFPISRLRSTILKPFSNQSTYVPVNGKEDCSLFYIKCSRETTHPKMEHYANSGDTLEDLFYTPWIARIHVNGNYQCTGVLVDLSWVLTSSYCFQHKLQNQSFLTVLLGTGKGNLLVQGPYEQIVVISNHFTISNSTAVLLKLQHPAIHTRYVRPVFLNSRIDINRERCLASETDKHGNIKTVKLKSVAQKCKKGFKCFSRKHPANETCESKPWSGVIVCESGGGWYASALFLEAKGYCGFNSVSKYPAVNTLINRISTILKNTSLAHIPECNGFRCKLGQCIETTKACDGVSDCRNSEDEEESYCTKQKETCQITKNCTCSKWEMKCANGRCVPKKSFCDRINDCGDGSDEPARCSCREYLKLSEPSKICDGVVHCRDSSDEQFCACDGSNFKCERSSTCVANATVCDGAYDCPKGEDEENCFALKPFNGTVTSGEVIASTAGEWHSGCFPPTMEQRKIDTICSILHLKGEHSKQLRTAEPEVTGRAIFDRFNVVHLSRTRNRIVWLKIRSGFDPYITYKNNSDNNCYKLFIDCK